MTMQTTIDQQQALSPILSVPPAGDTVCDRPGCAESSVFSYMFDWGESGRCCQRHAFLLQQSTGQMGRAVMLSPLVPAASVPMVRDERVRLKAEAYALEAELEDVKARGLELYRENEKLARTAQAATVRGTETEAQLKDARGELDKVRTELVNRDAEHANILDEVGRLRTISKFEPLTDHTRLETDAVAVASTCPACVAREAQLKDALAELEQLREERAAGLNRVD